jgi:hypothetical protein
VAAVESVRRSGAAPLEILVVNDGDAELGRRMRAELDVTVLDNDGPTGLSGARNAALNAAGGIVVAFLDDDAAAEPGWLELLAGDYTHDRVLGVGGAILPRWAGERPGWFPSEFDWVVGCTYTGMPTRPAPVRNLIGANMSLRREAARAAGGFDTRLGRVGGSYGGTEETQLCIRMTAARPDGVFVYEPRAQVHHVVPAERAVPGYFLRRCHGEGRSKALVVDTVGSTEGLATERDYIRKTLPAGLRRAVHESRMGPDRVQALARAIAIVAGLAATALGYVRGRLARGAGVPRGSHGPA